MGLRLCSRCKYFDLRPIFRMTCRSPFRSWTTSQTYFRLPDTPIEQISSTIAFWMNGHNVRRRQCSDYSRNRRMDYNHRDTSHQKFAKSWYRTNYYYVDFLSSLYTLHWLRIRAVLKRAQVHDSFTASAFARSLFLAHFSVAASGEK